MPKIQKGKQFWHVLTSIMCGFDYDLIMFDRIFYFTLILYFIYFIFEKQNKASDGENDFSSSPSFSYFYYSILMVEWRLE